MKRDFLHHRGEPPPLAPIPRAFRLHLTFTGFTGAVDILAYMLISLGKQMSQLPASYAPQLPCGGFTRQLLSCCCHFGVARCSRDHISTSETLGKLDKPFLGVFNNSVIDSRLQRVKRNNFTCRCFSEDTESVSVPHKTWKQNNIKCRWQSSDFHVRAEERNHWRAITSLRESCPRLSSTSSDAVVVGFIRWRHACTIYFGSFHTQQNKKKMWHSSKWKKTC